MARCALPRSPRARRFGAPGLLVLLGACAAYEPRALSPEESAQRFEARRLDDPGLVSAAREHLGAAAFPPAIWDLAALTEVALHYDPDLGVARGALAAERAAVRTADHAPNPVLALSPEYVTNAGSADPWVVGIALDWPIETAGKRGLRVERAQIEEARSILALRRAAWGAHSRVRAALSGRELALRERAAAGALLDLEEAHAASLRRAIDAGEIPRGALLTLEVEIARSRARTLEAEARASVALADLAAALAVPRSALDGAALAPFDLGAGPAEFDPDEQRRAALSGRSDLAAALLDFQVADVEVRTEVARQYPDLRLGPGYTWDQGAHKIALGLAFEVPLLHGQGAAIAEASARRERAAAAFEAAQVRAFGEIERARVGWDAARASAAAQDEVLLRARERERAAGSRLAAGAAGRAELSEAAIARAQAELDALDGARRVEEARRALEDALEHPLGEPLWTPLGAQVARGGTR